MLGAILEANFTGGGGGHGVGVGDATQTEKKKKVFKSSALVIPFTRDVSPVVPKRKFKPRGSKVS